MSDNNATLALKINVPSPTTTCAYCKKTVDSWVRFDDIDTDLCGYCFTDYRGMVEEIARLRGKEALSE